MDNSCDASFDETPNKKPRLSFLAGCNGQPIPEGIKIWWYSSEEKKTNCPEPNQSAYSAVQIQISML